MRGSDSTTAKSSTRPPMVAGPMFRNFRFFNAASCEFCAIAAGLRAAKSRKAEAAVLGVFIQSLGEEPILSHLAERKFLEKKIRRAPALRNVCELPNLFEEKTMRFSLGFAISAVAVLTTVTCLNPPPVRAADHRDAPAVDGAGEGDITDIYAFLNPKDKTRIVMAMGVNPLAVPALTHSYRFSNGFLYQFKVDNNGDYKEDAVVQVTFRDTSAGQTFHVRIGAPDTTSVGALNTLLTSPTIDISGPVGTVVNDSASTIQVFGG